MKLNFTREEVYADYEDAPKSYTKELQQDWLTYANEVEAQATLIEQLEKALLKVEHPCLDTNQNIAECAICGTQTKKHYDYCEVGLALSAIETWRKEQK